MSERRERKNPWYVLGQHMPQPLPMGEALELVKANDIVEPATLYTVDNDRRFVIDGVEYIRTSDLEEVEPAVGVKSSIYGTMSTSGPNYDIMQRSEVLRLAYEIAGYSGGDALVRAIGNIGQRAERFFAYLELPTLVIDPEGIADTITRGMYAATSFDGSLATVLGESDLRITCTNMLTMALKGLEKPIRVHHRVNAEQRIRHIAEAWEYAGAVEKAKLKTAEKMLKVDGAKAINEVLDHFWNVTEDDIPANTYTRRMNARDQVRSLYDYEGEQVGRNGWAAYNAITEYMDHYRPVRGANGDEKGKRAASTVLPGTTVNDKMKASRLITAIAA